MIGIDVGHALDRPPTGVAVYSRNLIRELAVRHPDQDFAWYYRSNRYLRSFGAPLPSNARRRLLEGFALPRSARRLCLFHGLNQRLPSGISAPAIATFHDLFALTGQYSTPDFQERFARLARETAARADHVIAVSAHTARQVVERLGLPESRVSVVHHGCEELRIPVAACREAILDSLGVQRPFVLHVGALQVRKNVERLVAAFEAAGEDCQLVLAGSLGFGAEPILDRIRRSSARERIRRVGHVSDGTRATLYACAEVLLFPSLEEGFGLPVVEAFSAGLPVIASRSSALSEVAGGAAELVDPLDPDAIANSLGRVLGSRDLQDDLRRKGRARAQRFTWRRCADETWKVYQALALS